MDPGTWIHLEEVPAAWCIQHLYAFAIFHRAWLVLICRAVLLPAIQLQFGNFYLGIAQGALIKAAGYTVKNTRGWPFSGDVKAKGVDEFYVQEIYGDLQAKVWGLESQFDDLGVRLGALIDRDDRESVTAEERGEIAVRVAGAKVTSTAIG